MRTAFDRVSPDAMPPVLILTAETTAMQTYSAKFSRLTGTNMQSQVVIIERFANAKGIECLHPRSGYTLTEAVITAQWLNERAKGYPRNPALDHLRNGRSP